MNQAAASQSRKLCWAVIFGGAAAIGACSPSTPPAAEKPDELAIVEVTAAPDAAYSIADDRIERRANPNAIAGALPDGFPPDIPVYRPSSLVDFTPRPEGGAVVVFASPAETGAVTSALYQKLRAAGWQAGAAGSWTKAGRKLRLVVEPTAAGSRFRFEF
ncbi:MAG: hypothetical protein ABIV06_01910 [Thermoanaerobaculia bacterium]